MADGHAAEKLDDNATRLNYLGVSDLQYFNSLMGLSDNAALASWIMERADDVNNRVNSFTGYAAEGWQKGFLTDLYNETFNAKKTADEITNEDVKKLVGKKPAEFAGLFTELETALSGADGRNLFTLAASTVDKALAQNSIGEQESAKILTRLLDKDQIKDATSLTHLVNDLFQRSSKYEADLNKLYDNAIQEAVENAEKAKTDLNDNQTRLNGAISSYAAAVNGYAGALDSLSAGIEAAIKLAPSVLQKLQKQAATEANNAAKAAKANGAEWTEEQLAQETERQYQALFAAALAQEKLPTEAGYTETYKATMAVLETYIGALKAAKTLDTEREQKEAQKQADRALSDSLTAEFKKLTDKYSDYKSEKTVSSSIESLKSLAKNYLNVIDDPAAELSAVENLLAENRKLSQRKHETNDGFTTETTAARIAQELDGLLKDGGTWETKLAAMNDRKTKLENAKSAYDNAVKNRAADAAQLEEGWQIARGNYETALRELQATYDRVYELMNTHFDQPSRALNLRIGEMYGSAYLYNNGDISIEVNPEYSYGTVYSSIQERSNAGSITVNDDHSSDITVANIRSERGDVSITNTHGGIFAADLDDSNSAWAAQEWIYRNDGKTYQGRFTGSLADGSWVTKPLSYDKFVDSDFARSWFTTGDFDSELKKNFEKVHIFAGKLTLSAKTDIGSEDNSLLTETGSAAPVKVANASYDVNPFANYGGQAYQRFDDVHYNIYDQLTSEDKNPTNYAKTTLESLYSAKLDLLHTNRGVGLAGDGEARGAAQILKEAIAGAVADGKARLVELTWTDESGEHRDWALEVSVRQDWLRENDVITGSTVSLTAVDGSVRVDEVKGDIAALSVTAGKDAVVSAQNGERAIGSEDSPIQANVGGAFTLLNSNATYMNSTGENLNLIGTSPNTHYEITTANDGEPHNVSLSDQHSTGNATVLSGSIRANGDVSIVTKLDIGTERTPFDLATGRDAKLSVQGANVNIRDTEVNTTVTLHDSVVNGDLNLNMAGSVAAEAGDTLYDTLMSDLLAKQETYNGKQNELAEAEALLSSVTNDSIAEKLRNAKNEEAAAKTKAEAKAQNLETVQAAAETAIADKTEELKELKEAYKEMAKGENGAASVEKLDALLNRITAKEAEIAEEQAKIDTARKESADADAALAKAQAATAEYQQVWDSMKDYPTRAVEEAEQKVAQAKNDIETAKANISAAEQAIIDSGDKLAEASGDAAKKADYDTAKAAYDAAEAAMSALDENDPAYGAAKAEYDNARQTMLDVVDALAASVDGENKAKQSDTEAKDAKAAGIEDKALAERRLVDAEKNLRITEQDVKNLRDYAQKQVDAKEAEAKKAGEELDRQKTLMEAQLNLNEAQKAEDRAKEVYEAAKAADPKEIKPETREAGQKAQMAENARVAAQALSAAEANVAAVYGNPNSSENDKLLADTAVKEIKELIAALQRAEDYVSGRDDAVAHEAMTTQADLGEAASDLDVALEQEKAAMDRLNAIEQYSAWTGNGMDEEHKTQAGTNLQAAKAEFKASEEAYDEQVKTIEARQRLEQAQEELAQAQENWNKLLRDRGIDPDAANSGEKVQNLLAKAMDDSKVKETRQALLNAEANVAKLTGELDAQTGVSNDANSKLQKSEDVMDKVDSTNKAISDEDQRKAELAEAKAEKDSLDTAKTNSTANVNSKKQAAITAINALTNASNTGLLDNTGDAKNASLMKVNEPSNGYILKNALEGIRNAVSTGTEPFVTTISEDSLETIAAELSKRLSGDAVTDQDKAIGGALTILSDALNQLFKAQAKDEEIDRQISDVNDRITALDKRADDNQAQLSTAKNAQQAVAGNLSAVNPSTDTTAQAAAGDNDKASYPDLDVSGDANIRTGGSFGQQNKPLSAEIGGKLNLTAGGEMGISSGKDLDLVRAIAGNDASLTTLGSIRDVSGGKDTVIGGKELILNAITGTSGDSSVGGDKAIRIDATSLGGTADDFRVVNVNKDATQLTDLTAKGEADLSFNGDVTQANGAVLAANKLGLTSTGKIGTTDGNREARTTSTDIKGKNQITGIEKPDGSIVVNAKDMTVKGTEADIYSIAPNTNAIVKGTDNIMITAIGNVNAGKDNLLNGKVVTLNGLGNFGTPAHGFVVPQGSDLRTPYSVYGLTNVSRQVIQIIRKGTEITPALIFLMHERGGALGYMSLKAKLIIRDLSCEGSDEASALIRRAADGKNLVKAVNVAIVNEDGSYYDGKIILMLEVEDLETGETVYALHRRNGELELLKGCVWKGYAVFATDGLSSEEESCIAIVDEAGLNELGLKPEEAADNGLTFDGKDFGILGGEFLDYLVQQLVEFRNETETAA